MKFNLKIKAFLIFALIFLTMPVEKSFADNDFVMKFTDLASLTLSSIDKRPFPATITLDFPQDEDENTYNAADCDLSGLTVTPKLTNGSVASFNFDKTTGILTITANNLGISGFEIEYYGTIKTPNGNTYEASIVAIAISDATVEVTNDGQHNLHNDNYSSSGGCNLGFNILFASLALMLFKKI